MGSVTTAQKNFNVPVPCPVSIEYAYPKTYEHTGVLEWNTHKFRHQKPHSNRKHNANRSFSSTDNSKDV
jgi:hypothetical protein